MKLPPSISSTIESLSKRPNVQSTLILSRADGSVISATGLLLAADPEDGGALDKTMSGESGKATPTAAEDLATSIFQFVSAANFLSNNMEPLFAQKSGPLDVTALAKDETYQSHKHNNRSDIDTNARDEDGEVQLLRMRTRKQEIIIYPDTKFLCCVIQAVGKAAQTHSNGAV